MSPRTHIRKFGTKGQHRANRFVCDGAVYIEWWARGERRRQQKIADTSTKVTRAAADAIIEDALARAQRRATPITTLTVSDLLGRYNADAARRPSHRTGERLRPDTLRLYAEAQAVLLRYLDPTTVAQRLRRGAVRVAMDTMRQAGLADGTVARTIQYLKAAYRWAVHEVELLEHNPLDGLKVPPIRAARLVYAPAELGAMVSELFERPRRGEWRFRTLIVLELVYGARISQVRALEWRDVDLDGGTLTFRQDVIGSKGQRDRIVPLIPLTRQALLEALNHRTESRWVLWHWRDAARSVREDTMYASLRRLERRAGVEHVEGRGFHAFRRGLATLVAERLGPKHASDWIHDTLATTVGTYIQPTTESMEATAAVLAELWPGAEMGKPAVRRAGTTEASSSTSMQISPGA
ncbi:MAG TPA: tyrosine-type recombinase/integrase [Gemmatimonadales bacterium]|nr:tyrosine-type recombinase/integrase [Gemmatimonadales bacterium]